MHTLHTLHAFLEFPLASLDTFLDLQCETLKAMVSPCATKHKNSIHSDIQVFAWEALQAALKDEDVDALSRVVAEALMVEHHLWHSPLIGTLKMVCVRTKSYTF